MPPATRRQEAEAVRAGAWRADCMADDEWAHWLAMNPMGLSDALVAARPCMDCPLGFAAEMRAEGRCNGSPGWRPPLGDDDEEDAEGLPVLMPLITLADPPVTPPEEPPMEAAPAAPDPVEPTAAEARIHALEELQSSALEALEAIQEHQLAEAAMRKAEDIHELALRRLSRAQQHVRELLEPQAVRLMDAPATEPPPADAASESSPNIPETIPEPLDDAPEVLTRPSRSEEAAGATKQAAILAAVIRFSGDLRAVAADRNTTPGNVVATLHNLGKRGRLTPEVIALLPAIYAKYSSVGA